MAVPGQYRGRAGFSRRAPSPPAARIFADSGVLPKGAATSRWNQAAKTLFSVAAHERELPRGFQASVRPQEGALNTSPLTTGAEPTPQAPWP